MGLSLTLFGLASLPLAFERTCALPAPVPAQLIQAGLGLLTASNDAARKNAALFFDAAVHYPVLLECFDSSDGLHRLLYPLQLVVQLLQAGGPAELRAERQVRWSIAHGHAWVLLLTRGLPMPGSVSNRSTCHICNQCRGGKVLHRLLYPLQLVVQLLQAEGPAELRAERQVNQDATSTYVQMFLFVLNPMVC
jgi:hypothetical protein